MELKMQDLLLAKTIKVLLKGKEEILKDQHGGETITFPEAVEAKIKGELEVIEISY